MVNTALGGLEQPGPLCALRCRRRGRARDAAVRVQERAPGFPRAGWFQAHESRPTSASLFALRVSCFLGKCVCACARVCAQAAPSASPARGSEFTPVKAQTREGLLGSPRSAKLLRALARAPGWPREDAARGDPPWGRERLPESWDLGCVRPGMLMCEGGRSFPGRVRGQRSRVWPGQHRGATDVGISLLPAHGASAPAELVRQPRTDAQLPQRTLAPLGPGRASPAPREHLLRVLGSWRDILTPSGLPCWVLAGSSEARAPRVSPMQDLTQPPNWVRPLAGPPTPSLSESLPTPGLSRSSREASPHWALLAPHARPARRRDRGPARVCCART